MTDVRMQILDWLSLASSEVNGSDTEEKEDDLALTEIQEAVEYLTSHFREPLEAKGVTLESIQDEVEEIVFYARKYLNIGTECYQKIWYKLYTSPDVRKWPCDLIHLSELLFSLPFSNGHVERMFSALKIVKTNRRTKLKTSTLSDLLDVKEEGPPLRDFNADKAVSMWWDACKTTRRVSQEPRKEYLPREKEQTEASAADIDLWPEEGLLDCTRISGTHGLAAQVVATKREYC